MELGYVGLGKMGFNMVERLLERGHVVHAFDQNPNAVKSIAEKGAHPVESLDRLVEVLTPPRLILIMVPYQAVDGVIDALSPSLQRGDTIIDGGNSPYRESIRRHRQLQDAGIEFLDVGVSGGPTGARHGACIMVGGRKKVFNKYRSLFRDLARRGGYAHMGPPGSGHFVKMIHNGIEYGMMQSIAEGFTLLKTSPFGIDLEKTATLYNRGSVIESRLIGWLRNAFALYGRELEDISGSVSHSGEGSWTIEEAHRLGIPVPVIEASLAFRIQSLAEPTYTGKILSALRNQFGGHDVFEKDNRGKGTNSRG